MKGKFLVLSLAAIALSIAGSSTTLSYFTDSDSSLANFTVGNISIETTTVKSNCSEMYYGDECTESITIKNTGNVPAYVRIRVLIPWEILTSYDTNGYPSLFGYSFTTPDGTSIVPANAYQQAPKVTVDGIEYGQFTITYANQLSANVATEATVLTLKNYQNASATSDNVNDSECTTVEGSCSTMTTSVSVSLKDAGIIIYTQAIQAQGFSSATEAFNNFK